MKRIWGSLLMGVVAAAIGCNPSTPGGPGATSTAGGDRKTALSTALSTKDDSFTLKAPWLSTTLKQGEAKVVDIGISRGNNFDEDVNIKFDELPTGVTIEPATPVLKHGDKNVKVTIKVADDAAIGKKTVKLVGHPEKGSDAASEMTLNIEKK